jgi:hypothetical protein
LVTGTLDEPKVTLPPGETVWQQFSRILSDEPKEGDGVVADDLTGLARETAANVAEGLAETLSRIRERRAERRATRDAANDPPEEDSFDSSEFAGQPGDPSGDALPPPPPDESGSNADWSDARDEETGERSPARGPLRRLLDRRRERRS